MRKQMTKPWLKYTLLGALVLVVDLSVYLYLGLLLMNYEDFHGDNLGSSSKLVSMDAGYRAFLYGSIAWNLVNLTGISYVAYRLFKLYKQRTGGYSEKCVKLRLTTNQNHEQEEDNERERSGSL